MSNAALKMPPPPQEPAKFSTAQKVGFKPANRNKRVIALVLDGIFMAVLTGIAMIALKPVFSSMGETGALLMLLTQPFINIAYMTCFPVFMDATPGKQFLGIRVMQANGKSQPTLGQMFLRETVGRIASIVPLGLGYLWVSFNKDRKTFHDMIAKTWVVEYR